MHQPPAALPAARSEPAFALHLQPHEKDRRTLPDTTAYVSDIAAEGGEMPGHLSLVIF